VKGLLALSDDYARRAATLFLQSTELAAKQGALAGEPSAGLRSISPY